MDTFLLDTWATQLDSPDSIQTQVLKIGHKEENDQKHTWKWRWLTVAKAPRLLYPSRKQGLSTSAVNLSARSSAEASMRWGMWCSIRGIRRTWP